MARLTRKNIKVFAKNATNNGVFGSLQAGTATVSNDVEAIQSLSGAWSGGWNYATLTSEKLPPLEEFQGIQYVITYQQAYLMQEGLPEWAGTVTYYQSSLVKQVTPTGFRIYSSLTDDNTNNPLSDSTNWKKVMDSDDLYAFDNTVVHLAGTETIVGDKTFSGANVFSVSPLVPNVTSGDSSTKAANTAFVTGLTDNLQTQINQKANASDVVTLTTSQTITGTKTITSRLRRQSNEITKGVAPASTVNTVIGFVDQNGDSLGNVYHSYANNKISAVAIQAIKANTSSDSDYANVAVFYPASGNPYATAPASDVTNSIVTTVNKSKSANGYFKLGNGMIVQWGRVKVSVGPLKTVSTITLPSAFSTTNYTFCACFENNTSSQTTYTDDVSFVTTSISTTQVRGFGFDAGGNAYDTYMRWTAIGY